jgi:HlyD family secretion protein
MPNPSPIFRQAALDRLSSPEQLDQMMQVTTPKSWLALTACCILVLTALAWGIWGSIPSKVRGHGILMKEGGVFVTTARAEGNVAEILVGENELVVSNQLLARLELPDLRLRIRQAEIAQSNLVRELAELEKFHAKEVKLEGEDLSTQDKYFSLMLTNQQAQVRAWDARLFDMTQATNTDLFSRPLMLELTNSFFSMQHDLARTSIAVEQLKINQLQAEERRYQQRLEKDTQVRQGDESLQYLTRIYRLNSEIRSPYGGEVLEITIKSNQVVNPNTPIISLQAAQGKLHAWLFLAPADGKRVRPNMDVALEPVSVKKERSGLMIGRVESVSSFPATPQFMLRILENPALVSELSQGGAPMSVVVELRRDANSLSGYQWTSGRGPKMKITSGTLCEGSISLATNHPINLVLPLPGEDASP